MGLKRPHLGDGLKFKIIVLDRNGKVKDVREGVSESYVANYNKLCFICVTGNATELVDSDGSSKTIFNSDLPNIECDAPEGDDSYGIIVGTGSDPSLPGMYNLQSKI